MALPELSWAILKGWGEPPGLLSIALDCLQSGNLPEGAAPLSYSSLRYKIALRLQAFNEDIQAIADKMTTCTLALYEVIVHDLPPTPSKFHYIFNLRDLSRIYNGLVQTTPER